MPIFHCFIFVAIGGRVPIHATTFHSFILLVFMSINFQIKENPTHKRNAHFQPETNSSRVHKQRIENKTKMKIMLRLPLWASCSFVYRKLCLCVSLWENLSARLSLFPPKHKCDEKAHHFHSKNLLHDNFKWEKLQNDNYSRSSAHCLKLK